MVAGLHEVRSGVTVAAAGPVDPSAPGVAQLRPVPFDAVRLDPAGFLGAWQDLNARATVPHCIASMESSGVLHNFRRVNAPGADDDGFRGLWFADSDLYKTLEAAAWELGRSGDEALATFVDEATALVAAAQQDDGYLDTRFAADPPETRFSQLVWSHEMYVVGHLIQAAVAAARAAGRTGLLDVARRAADLLVRTFGPGGTDGIDGHPEIETALVELYRLTGERSYLELAGRMVELRGHGLLRTGRRAPDMAMTYYQDHLPVRRATEAVGHAVRQNYLAAGVMDVYLETGDATLLAAQEALWRDAVGTKTYVTGGQGAHHKDEAYGDAYELPPDRAYAETCAGIASFMWSWRMLLATGDGRYADEMERTLHNAIPAAVSLDGTHFFYTNPLQLRGGHRVNSELDPNERLSWYKCACCPPNLARLVASLHSYVATATEGSLAVHLYGAGQIRADVPGGPTVHLHVATRYPWDGGVDVDVVEGDGTWELALRVPGWCPAWSVSVDGVPVESPVVADGYVRLSRQWRAGTRVTLALTMPVRTVRAHPRVDAVRGCVALTRGPVVYCLEQVDQEDGVQLEDIVVPAGAAFEAVESSAVPGAPVLLVGTGGVLANDDAAPYGDATPVAAPTRSTVVTAIPYFRWSNRGPSAMRVWIPVVG